MKKYSVTLDGVTVKASDVDEALEVAADLIEVAGASVDIRITCDGDVEQVLIDLAREGLRPRRER